MPESTKNREAGTNSLGLRSFNQTGREDTTTEVLRPKTDPATVRRNAILIGVVIVAFLFASYFVFLRSGLDIRNITAPTGDSFGRGHTDQNFDAKESDKENDKDTNKGTDR